MAETTKVKVDCPCGDESRVVENAFLREGANGDPHLLGVGVAEGVERPIKGGLDNSCHILALEAGDGIELLKHLWVVLANHIAGELYDLALWLAIGLGTAPSDGAVDGEIDILGVVCLLHLRINHALLDIFGVAGHEALGGRPKLDACGADPSTTPAPTGKMEGRGANLRPNIIRLAAELATLVDHHCLELLHDFHSQVKELVGILPLPNNTYIISYLGAKVNTPFEEILI